MRSFYGQAPEGTRPDRIYRLAQELFESWYSSVLRYAWRRTGDLGIAEDMVQETFLALCRELHNGAEIRHPKAWTLVVLRRKISRTVYLEKDRGVELTSVDDVDSRYLATDPLEQERTDARLEIDQITRLFGHVSAREEEVVLLRMEGLKLREIGECLEIAPQTAHTLLQRAFKKLRAVVESNRQSKLSDAKVGAADDAL